MKHKATITLGDETLAESTRKAEADQVRWAYLRVFESEDGQRVLADLVTKFGTQRSRFRGAALHSDALINASLIDGCAMVVTEITEAVASAKKK